MHFGHSVVSAYFLVNTMLSCFEKKVSAKNHVGCMIALTYVEHSFFKHLTPFISLLCVLCCRVLFIAGPSEPRLINIIAYILSDPSPPFQLAAAGEESQEKKVSGPKYGWAHVFLCSCALPMFPAVWCCGARPSCREAPLQLSEQRLDVVTERQRVQREWVAELKALSHGLLQMNSGKSRLL